MQVDLFLELTISIYLLILSSFFGFEVISKVPTMLHTPLMSGSNAISGIIILGAITVVSLQDSYFSRFLGYIAIICATINLVGGFVVTDRMLGMFRGKRKSS